MRFLDVAKVYAQSGAGGNGCIAFRREKFIEYGGAYGCDGGRGGDVIAEAVENLITLIDFRFQQHVKAGNGEGGKGKVMAGANGADAVMKVPAGTQIYEEDGETLIADLAEAGQRVKLLRGGNPGLASGAHAALFLGDRLGNGRFGALQLTELFFQRGDLFFEIGGLTQLGRS